MITIWMFCFSRPATRRMPGIVAQQLLGLGVAHTSALVSSPAPPSAPSQRDRRGGGSSQQVFSERDAAATWTSFSDAAAHDGYA